MQKIFLNSAGNQLVGCEYIPKGASAGFSFIINAATGTKQHYYRHFANYMAKKGIRVLTYDYSGIGESAPPKMKGFQTNMMQWGKSDMTTMINYASTDLGTDKLILIGQSVGGQIAGLTPAIHQVDGLINVASQTGYWKIWPQPLRYGLWVNWQLLTLLTNVVGYFPGKRLGIMEDLPKEVALEWAKWGRSPNYLFDFMSKEDQQTYQELSLPLLSYSFSDDTTAPRASVVWLNQKYPNCKLIDKYIKPTDIGVKHIGHFGFFRKSCTILWEDLLTELTNNF